MKMSNKFERLEREDVVSVYAGQILVSNRTFTVDEFIAALMQILQKHIPEMKEDKEKWFGEGLGCKLLKPGAKSWQRGKVRITLEFSPEELIVEEDLQNNGLQSSKLISPLDDIRQMMPKDS